MFFSFFMFVTNKKINSAKINKQPALKAHAEDNRVGVGDPRVWRTTKTYSNAQEVRASNEKTWGMSKRNSHATSGVKDEHTDPQEKLL